MFNLLNRKPKELSEDIDLSVLKTDVHSHLIPDVDDGSKSLEESIYLLKQLEELGYKKVITTPHVFYNSFPNGISVLDEKLESLKRNAEFNSIGLDIELGGEFLLDDDIKSRIESKEIKTFGDNYFLFEFPMGIEPKGYEAWLFNLQLAGFNLILAHPERYLYFFRQKKKYEELKDRGILFQINIASLSGYYGNEVKEAAEYLIREGVVELVGSDCHGQRHIDAIKRTLRTPSLKYLIDSGNLINNKL